MIAVKQIETMNSDELEQAYCSIVKQNLPKGEKRKLCGAIASNPNISPKLAARMVRYNPKQIAKNQGLELALQLCAEGLDERDRENLVTSLLGLRNPPDWVFNLYTQTLAHLYPWQFPLTMNDRSYVKILKKKRDSENHEFILSELLKERFCERIESDRLSTHKNVYSRDLVEYVEELERCGGLGENNSFEFLFLAICDRSWAFWTSDTPRQHSISDLIAILVDAANTGEWQSINDINYLYRCFVIWDNHRSISYNTIPLFLCRYSSSYYFAHFLHDTSKIETIVRPIKDRIVSTVKPSRVELISSTDTGLRSSTLYRLYD